MILKCIKTIQNYLKLFKNYIKYIKNIKILKNA